jgi:hypothetical protein
MVARKGTMPQNKESGQALYGTKQVAKFLGIPEWRVKNFSEGGAYGLPPSQTLGTGRGSRRLYTVNRILRLAIANELVVYGFTPETVGRAVGEIPESMLIRGLGQSSAPSRPLLVCTGGELEWRVRNAPEVKDLLLGTIEGTAKRRGVFALDFINLLKDTVQRMTRLTGLTAEGDQTKGGEH